MYVINVTRSLSHCVRPSVCLSDLPGTQATQAKNGRANLKYDTLVTLTVILTFNLDLDRLILATSVIGKVEG